MSESKKFTMEPMCCSCMKGPEEIRPTDFPQSRDPVYWFIFPNENPKENPQDVDGILGEFSQEDPRKKQLQFGVITRKIFDFNFEHNILCPDCAKEFLSEVIGGGEDGSQGSPDEDEPWKNG